MKDIQELIDYLIVERAKANEAEKSHREYGYSDSDYFLGKEAAFALCIQQLTLLLNSTREQSQKAAHCANTMLDEVPQPAETTNNGETGADFSETGSVGQNEQTKEVCSVCKQPFPDEDYQRWGICFDCLTEH